MDCYSPVAVYTVVVSVFVVRNKCVCSRALRGSERAESGNFRSWFHYDVRAGLSKAAVAVGNVVVWPLCGP